MDKKEIKYQLMVISKKWKETKKKGELELEL